MAFVAKHRRGRKVDVHVTKESLKIWDESEPLNLALRAGREKEVRVKTAQPQCPKKKS